MDEQTYQGTYYREIGDFLREAYLDLPFAGGTFGEVDFLESLLALPVGAAILDVGCGPGRHSLELARRGYHPTGIDISAGFIDVADVCAKHDGLRATFRVADARDLPFPSSGMFDAAISLCQGAFGVVGSESSHRLVLREVYRVLKPGALFVLTAVNAYAAARNGGDFDAANGILQESCTLRNTEGELRQVRIYTSTFTPRELLLMLEAAGFIAEAMYGCEAGNYSRRPPSLADHEILAVARRA